MRPKHINPHEPCSQLENLARYEFEQIEHYKRTGTMVGVKDQYSSECIRERYCLYHCPDSVKCPVYYDLGGK